MRIWKVAAIIEVPLGDQDTAWPASGFPDNFTIQPRVQDREFKIGPVAARLRPGVFDTALVQESGNATLSLRVEARSGSEACEQAVTLAAAVLDGIGFQLQQPVWLLRLSALDVTPPVQEGDTREELLWPQGYPSVRFTRTVYLGHAATRPVPDPTLRLELDSAQQREALHWHMKSLAAAFLIDRFLFLWIALEILSKASSIRAVEPLRLEACKHVVPKCPECGKSTEKSTLGANIRGFLSQACGVSEPDARSLWDLRQVVHGAVPLASARAQEMQRLVPVLSSAVVERLKAAFGLPDAAPPVMHPRPTGIRAEAAITIERAVTPADLEP